MGKVCKEYNYNYFELNMSINDLMKETVKVMHNQKFNI